MYKASFRVNAHIVLEITCLVTWTCPGKSPVPCVPWFIDATIQNSAFRGQPFGRISLLNRYGVSSDTFLARTPPFPSSSPKPIPRIQIDKAGSCSPCLFISRKPRNNTSSYVHTSVSVEPSRLHRTPCPLAQFFSSSFSFTFPSLSGLPPVYVHILGAVAASASFEEVELFRC